MKNRGKKLFSYTVKRKKIKNIILKIRPNGNIEISAPFKTSESKVKEFVSSKSSWIQNHINSLEEKKAKQGINHEKYIYILGERFLMSNEQLLNSSQRKEFVIELYKLRSIEIITPLIEKFSALTELKVESVKYKFMKTRWGSCNSKKRCLNLNTMLMASPIEAIEYVILHEISHIKYPNHQSEFWNFIAYFMPDWENRKDKLIYLDL